MWSTIPIFYLLFLRRANAYTWQFTSQPHQCQNVSIAVQGSGQPPYSLLIIPSGPTPIANNIEVRTVQSIPFSGSSTSLSFKLNYPENSSFVAVVSDSSGFGTGGTSIPVAVLPSSDSSCYNSTKNAEGAWVFNVDPQGGITQCESVRLWWEQEFANGTVNFNGVIPGGNSFNIPRGSLSTNNITGTGYPWTVDITGGTNMFIVGGDDNGIGTGGSAPFTVAYSANNSCLSKSSPSSTAGNPAGGSYPTSISGSSSGGSSGSRSNTGAIAGGVAGGLIGIVAVALIAFFYFRRQGYAAVSKEHHVNVLHDDEDGNVSHQELPHYYTPEPYLVPDPTIGGTSEAASIRDRPLSMATLEVPRPLTPASMTTATTRKTTPMPQLRPVNIIQHDDAGPSIPEAGVEPDTIELPPAYTALRAGAGAKPAGK